MSKKSVFFSTLLMLPLLATQGHAQQTNSNNMQNDSHGPFPYVPVQHLPSEDCQLLATKVNADIHRVRSYIFNGADWFDSDTWGIANRINTIQGGENNWDDEQTDNVKILLTRDVRAAQNAGCVSEQDTIQAVDAWIERVKTVVPNPVSTNSEIRATRAGIPVVSYVYMPMQAR